MGSTLLAGCVFSADRGRHDSEPVLASSRTRRIIDALKRGPPMILERTLVNESHTHRFVVSSDSPGWNVREEVDSRVIQHTHLNDWHRVELATRMFEHSAKELEASGWVTRSP
jgi:hypothetical protein